MKFVKDNLIVLIVAGLCLWNIFNTSSIKSDLTSYKKEIKLTQKKIDSTNAENVKLSSKIDSVNTTIMSINKELNHIDNSIITIKKSTYEKVSAVDRLGNVELQSLFTARYYKGYPSDSAR